MCFFFLSIFLAVSFSFFSYYSNVKNCMNVLNMKSLKLIFCLSSFLTVCFSTHLSASEEHSGVLSTLRYIKNDWCNLITIAIFKFKFISIEQLFWYEKSSMLNCHLCWTSIYAKILARAIAVCLKLEEYFFVRRSVFFCTRVLFCLDD